MTHTTRWLGAALALWLATGCSDDRQAAPDAAAPTAAPQITVYKSPTCGCCGKWVDHLRSDGFVVAVVDEQNLAPRKSELGVPERFGSCHTAVVDDYVIEGHVPATDIRRLLRERPAARGLAVPGMPIGSPGMEMGERRDPYTVWLFDAGEPPQAFSRHGDAN